MPSRPLHHCAPCLLRLGIVVMVCLSLGMHRGVLQTVAWARMLADFAAERPLLEAVEMTFDGEHPCELCRIAQDKEPASPSQPLEHASGLKKLFAVVCDASAPVFSSPEVPRPKPDLRRVKVKLMQQPETPPPRRGEA